MSEQVQSMTDILAGGATPSEDPETALKRKQRYAALGMLMNVQPTVGVAEMLTKQVEGERDRRADTSSTKRRYLGNGFIMEPDGNVVRDEGMAAAELEREQRLLGRMGYQNELISNRPKYGTVDTEGGIAPTVLQPGGGSPTVQVGTPAPYPKPQPAPSAADFQKRRESLRLQQEARELSALLEQQPGAASAGKSAVTDLIGKLPVVGGPAGSAVGEKLYSPDERSVITRGAAFEQDLSNLAAGLAVTGFELEQRNRWSPFVPGISAAESRRRLANIEQRFGRRADVAAPPRGQSPAGNAGGGEEVYERGPDGKLRRVP